MSDFNNYSQRANRTNRKRKDVTPKTKNHNWEQFKIVLKRLYNGFKKEPLIIKILTIIGLWLLFDMMLTMLVFVVGTAFGIVMLLLYLFGWLIVPCAIVTVIIVTFKLLKTKDKH